MKAITLNYKLKKKKKKKKIGKQNITKSKIKTKLKIVINKNKINQIKENVLPYLCVRLWPTEAFLFILHHQPSKPFPQCSTQSVFCDLKVLIRVCTTDTVRKFVL